MLKSETQKESFIISRQNVIKTRNNDYMVTVPFKSIHLMMDTVVLFTLLGMGQLPFRLEMFIGKKPILGI